MTGEALVTDGLSRSFRIGLSQRREAVRDLSIRIRSGDVYGFLGPNGAGKTTAIRLILGLLRPDRGTVAIFGETHPVKRLHRVGAMVETPCFYERMTGRQNLVRAHVLAKGSDLRNIDEVLEKVGLRDRAEDKVKTYSLGMRQRLGIARALLAKPRLLVLDEPTNGLDPRGMKEVRTLLRQLALEESLTIVISSHLLAEVEMLCSHIGIIDDGRLVAEGTQDEIRSRRVGRITEVEFGGPDLSAIRRALAEIPSVVFSSIGHENRIRVRSETLSVAELNTRLVVAGLAVDAIVPVGSALEDSFLELTREPS